MPRRHVAHQLGVPRQEPLQSKLSGAHRPDREGRIGEYSMPVDDASVEPEGEHRVDRDRRVPAQPLDWQQEGACGGVDGHRTTRRHQNPQQVATRPPVHRTPVGGNRRQEVPVDGYTGVEVPLAQPPGSTRTVGARPR